MGLSTRNRQTRRVVWKINIEVSLGSDADLDEVLASAQDTLTRGRILVNDRDVIARQRQSKEKVR